jgi:protein tyrosine/serine phosphatase
VRDLGGLPLATGGITQFGRVFRADDVGRLDADGWVAARSAGVTRVVDLRYAEERSGDRWRPPQVETVHISLLGDRDPAYWRMLHAHREEMGEAAYMRQSYTEFLDRHSPRFVEAIEAIAASPGATVVHCIAGKDRTGLVVGLLLRLAGVPIDAVDGDYALSEAFLIAAGFVAVDANGDGRPPRSPAGVMADVLTSLEEQYGSAEGYLSSAGCGRAALDAARSILT